MVWVRLPVYIYKRKDTFYFSRAVPADLRHKFKKKKIELSLRTRSEARARKAAAALSDKLERYWDSLRIETIFMQEADKAGVTQTRIQVAPIDYNFNDALSLYHRLKGEGKNESFFSTSTRCIDYLADCLDHTNLCMIEPIDGGKFRDYLFERGLSSSSVRRIFGTVRSVIGLAIREYGLEHKNPFSNTFLPNDTRAIKRIAMPREQIAEIQSICKTLDDPARWLIALLSDTGLRLSEACGLLNADINVHVAVPFVNVQCHPWRRLKTLSSTRQVPLVGASLWAAQRIKENANEFAFPKYCSYSECKGNSASAALNKWLKPRVSDGCVVHSFRHSLRDRLRDLECPFDIVNEIGGWATSGVGQQYGDGYSLKVKARWMEKISIATR